MLLRGRADEARIAALVVGEALPCFQPALDGVGDPHVCGDGSEAVAEQVDLVRGGRDAWAVDPSLHRGPVLGQDSHAVLACPSREPGQGGLAATGLRRAPGCGGMGHCDARDHDGGGHHDEQCHDQKRPTGLAEPVGRHRAGGVSGGHRAGHGARHGWSGRWGRKEESRLLNQAPLATGVRSSSGWAGPSTERSISSSLTSNLAVCELHAGRGPRPVRPGPAVPVAQRPRLVEVGVPTRATGRVAGHPSVPSERRGSPRCCWDEVEPGEARLVGRQDGRAAGNTRPPCQEGVVGGQSPCCDRADRLVVAYEPDLSRSGRFRGRPDPRLPIEGNLVAGATIGRARDYKLDHQLWPRGGRGWHLSCPLTPAAAGPAAAGPAAAGPAALSSRRAQLVEPLGRQETCHLHRSTSVGCLVSATFASRSQAGARSSRRCRNGSTPTSSRCPSGGPGQG